MISSERMMLLLDLPTASTILFTFNLEFSFMHSKIFSSVFEISAVPSYSSTLSMCCNYEQHPSAQFICILFDKKYAAIL